MPIKKNDIIEITPTSFGSSGETVGSIDGYKVFIEGALPGELVKAEVTQVKKSYAKGELEQVITRSPHRVTPICPLFGTCGGCQIMHLAYEEQLVVKRHRVIDALERIGHLKDVDVKPCIASPNPLHYRNKIQLPVGGTENNKVIGLYGRGSHTIVPVETCYIHSDLGDNTYSIVRKLILESDIIPYEESSGKGELRHLLIKTAVQNQEVLVVFITTGKSKGKFQKLAEKVMKSCSLVKGVVMITNSRKDNKVLSDTFETLAGASFIHERILGKQFKISPASFFQVNALQAENLYAQAIEYADLDSSKILLDAYCGVGTLGLLSAGQAKEVIGIECVPQAIVDAKYNAELNGIKNSTFICGSAERVIGSIQTFDVAILNPPRTGCDPLLLKSVCEKKPETIVYVSCDPATLARDLSILTEYGYEITEVQPFDMFPQTMHVENVVKLIKK